MLSGILQASTENRGIVFDPRTKFLLLITMATFVLGGAGGEDFQIFLPVFCVLPMFMLLSAKKVRLAIQYMVLYTISIFVIFNFGDSFTGIINFLLLGSCALLSRFLPCIMMGTYLISTTTVSEFTAAMQRMHLSEKIIIPLSVMFRFFPTVIDEFQSINAAMKMRDIQFGGAGASKMIEYRIVPLMICCVKIGEELSAAALTRGLGGTVRRTNICKIGFHLQDWFVNGLCFVAFGLLILHFFGVNVGGLL